MNFRAEKVIVVILAFCLLAVWAPGYAQEEDYSPVCEEIKAAGFKIVDSGVAYGVPFVKIKIPLRLSITSLCRSVPSLSREFSRCRNRLAFFNSLNPNYIKTRTSEPHSIEADALKIPLDLRRVPEVFPGIDPSLSTYEQYLLVDIGKNFLALYERGELTRVFPISPGKPGDRTPLMNFRIQSKDENHWSSIYETWMPWSLQMQGPYYIHGGVLPGRSDSAGCVRMPLEDAEKLFKLVKVGTPGRVIETSKVRQDIYPAPFCR
jgi:hypothetical protein